MFSRRPLAHHQSCFRRLKLVLYVKHDPFLTLTKCFWFLNLTSWTRWVVPTWQRQLNPEKRKVATGLNKFLVRRNAHSWHLFLQLRCVWRLWSFCVVKNPWWGHSDVIRVILLCAWGFLLSISTQGLRYKLEAWGLGGRVGPLKDMSRLHFGKCRLQL